VLYHGLRLQDASLCRWSDQVVVDGGERAPLDPFPAILVEDRVDRTGAAVPPNDRVFRGIGWAALHSDVTQPQQDLMVLFRSSPYGGVSHGHASQNDFAVMKGGRALICAGGERFPHHGSLFHVAYAQQSISHNCVLVDGQGAINRDGNRGGEIVAFSSNGSFGYVCGEAENAYGDLLNKCRRHLALVRPATLILVDDLHAPEPSTFEWLLHAFERFEIDPSGGEHSITSRRGGASLTGQLYASTGLRVSQTDRWPIEPDEGYPTLTRPVPPRRWHLAAETGAVERVRIACVFNVQGPSERAPDLSVKRSGERILLQWGPDASGEICLDPDAASVLRVRHGGNEIEAWA
jgi:hypothetical protein